MMYSWYQLTSSKSGAFLCKFTWWRHQMETFPRYLPFVRGIYRSPVNFPHKGQWRGPLMFSLICAWTNGWVNNRYFSDLIRQCAHYDVTVMIYQRLSNALVTCMAFRTSYVMPNLPHNCTQIYNTIYCAYLTLADDEYIFINHAWDYLLFSI